MNPFPFAIYPLSFQKANKKRPQPMGRRPIGSPQRGAASSSTRQAPTPSGPQIPATSLQTAITQAIASSGSKKRPVTPSGGPSTRSIRTTDFDRTAKQQEYLIKDPHGNVHSLVATEIDPSSIPARFREILEMKPTSTNAVKLRRIQGKIANRLAREGIFFQEGRWYFNGSNTGGSMLFHPMGAISQIIRKRSSDASGKPMVPPMDLDEALALFDPTHPDHEEVLRKFMKDTDKKHYVLPKSQPIAILKRSLAEFLRGKGFTDEQIEKVINDNHAQHHADAMDLADEHVLRIMRLYGDRWGDEEKKLRPEDLYDMVHRRPAYFIEPAVARKVQEYLDFHAQPFAEGKTHKDTSEAAGQLLGTTSIDPETGTPFVHVLHFVPPGTTPGFHARSVPSDDVTDATVGQLLHESPALSVVGMIHSHPAGTNWYPSDMDDEVAMLTASGHPFLSLIQQSNAVLRRNRGALKDASDPRGNEPDYVSGPEARQEMVQGGATFNDHILGRRSYSQEAPDSLTVSGFDAPSMSMFGPYSETAAFLAPRRSGVTEMTPTGATERKQLERVVTNPKTEVQGGYTKPVGYHVPLRGTSAYEFPSQIQVLGMGSAVPIGGSMRMLSKPESPTEEMLWQFQQYESPFNRQGQKLEQRHVDLPSLDEVARMNGWPQPFPWARIALDPVGSRIRQEYADLIRQQYPDFDHPQHNLPRLRDVVPTTEIKGSETPLPRRSKKIIVDPSKVREIFRRMTRPREAVRTGSVTFAGTNEGVADPITQQIAQTKKDTAEKIIGRIRSERASGLNTTISPHTKSFFFAARWLHWL